MGVSRVREGRQHCSRCGGLLCYRWETVLDSQVVELIELYCPLCSHVESFWTRPMGSLGEFYTPRSEPEPTQNPEGKRRRRPRTMHGLVSVLAGAD